MTVTDFAGKRGNDAARLMLGLARNRAARLADVAAERFPPFASGEGREALRRLAVAIAGALIVTAGRAMANLGYIHGTGNIHTVEPGELYRSATLSQSTLARLVGERGIRTIVNLRGDEDSDWFAAERGLAAKNGIDLLSFHLSAKDIPARKTLEEIVFVLQTAPRPILVHCKSGSDRTGLIAAIYDYALSGKTAEQAARQLSFDYGHFPWLGSRTAAMDEAFTRFAAEYPDVRPILPVVVSDNMDTAAPRP